MLQTFRETIIILRKSAIKWLEKTGKIYKLGQKVRVTVSAVDKLLRTIDFELNEEDENEHGEETDRK